MHEEKMFPLVIVYHRNSDPQLHFFDYEEAAIFFRKSVNSTKIEGVTKAIYKGLQPYKPHLSYDEYFHHIKGHGRGRSEP